jgi:hypothetical protein
MFSYCLPKISREINKRMGITCGGNHGPKGIQETSRRAAKTVSPFPLSLHVLRTIALEGLSRMLCTFGPSLYVELAASRCDIPTHSI